MERFKVVSCENCCRDLFGGHRNTQWKREINEHGEQVGTGIPYCSQCYFKLFDVCMNCSQAFERDSLFYSDREQSSICDRCRPGSEAFAKPFPHKNLTFNVIGSTRRFGVELETSQSPDFHNLNGLYPFRYVRDGSVSGMEFVSEPLAGDQGLEAIYEFCRVTRSLKYKVDNHCGFHVHFSIADLTVEQLKSVACAYAYTYPMWAGFVARSRRNNRYCMGRDRAFDRLRDVVTEDQLIRVADRINRYQWLNLNAIAKHGTIEVRLHGGTLNARRISAWVMAHARFIDWAAAKSVAEIIGVFGESYGSKSIEEKFGIVSEVWNSKSLTEYFDACAKRFQSRTPRRRQRRAVPSACEAPVDATFSVETPAVSVSTPYDAVGAFDQAYRTVQRRRREHAQAEAEQRRSRAARPSSRLRGRPVAAVNPVVRDASYVANEEYRSQQSADFAAAEARIADATALTAPLDPYAVAVPEPVRHEYYTSNTRQHLTRPELYRRMSVEGTGTPRDGGGWNLQAGEYTYSIPAEAIQEITRNMDGRNQMHITFVCNEPSAPVQLRTN